MNETVREILAFVEENDIKFIRLAFCDSFGMQKNISIMPDELERAFQHGISFDASAIRGFMGVERSDLFLQPDPGTLSILPWRPMQGRVARFFCNIRYPDGRPFEGDGRYILKNAVQRCADMGYTCRIGAECEFYLFQLNEDGEPVLVPHDKGGYFDISPLDKGENVRREICLTLEEMGLRPESSHHEQGPGQNEIDFHYSDACTAADDLITFKSVVKAISLRNGLFASFLPKPFADQSGSGLHINISLSRDGENLFQDLKEEGSVAASFIAGVLDRAAEITAFLNPLTNSYARFGAFEAPRFIAWSRMNRAQLVRIPATSLSEHSRMEVRSPDPACNPYLAYTLLLEAGMEGIAQGKRLGPAMDFDPYAPGARVEGLPKLPATLEEALALAGGSEFVRRVLPQTVVDKYLEFKSAQAHRVAQAEDRAAMERELYFLSI